MRSTILSELSNAIKSDGKRRYRATGDTDDGDDNGDRSSPRSSMVIATCLNYIVQNANLCEDEDEDEEEKENTTTTNNNSISMHELLVKLCCQITKSSWLLLSSDSISPQSSNTWKEIIFNLDRISFILCLNPRTRYQ